MFRPRIPFDATLRLTEMAAIQFAFYLVYLLAVMLLDSLRGLSFTREQLIGDALFNLWSPLGRAAVAGQFLGGAAAAALFCLLEARARDALDFIATAHALHAAVATALCRFPRSLFWWAASAASCAVSTVIAGSLSAWLEMRAVSRDIAVLERARATDARP